MTDDAKTLPEWNREGFRVRKGAKACGRNETGVALFSYLDVYRVGPGHAYTDFQGGGSLDHGAADWDDDESDYRY